LGLVYWCNSVAVYQEGAAGLAAFSFLACEFLEFGTDFLYDGGPVGELGLAEEAEGGVPGGVGAVEHPAPVGGEGEEDPCGFGECAGEVDEGGVDGDEEVEVFEEGGGVGEIVEVGGEVDHAGVEKGFGGGGGGVFLEVVKGDAVDAEEVGEGGGGDGTEEVGGVGGAAGPGDADFEFFAGGGELFAPAGGGGGIGVEVGGLGGDGFERCAEDEGETQEGAVQVERRGCFGIGDDLVDAGHAGE